MQQKKDDLNEYIEQNKRSVERKQDKRSWYSDDMNGAPVAGSNVNPEVKNTLSKQVIAEEIKKNKTTEKYTEMKQENKIKETIQLIKKDK